MGGLIPQNAAPRGGSLAVLPLDAEPSTREPPVDVAVGAAEDAGRALHAVVVGHRDLRAVPHIDVGRAERRAGPLPPRPARLETHARVLDADVRLFVVFPAKRIEF